MVKVDRHAIQELASCLATFAIELAGGLDDDAQAPFVRVEEPLFLALGEAPMSLFL